MQNNIESHLVEKRVFKPSRDFAKNTRIKSLDQYRRMYRESIRQPAKFWAREASELVWRAPWKKVLEWKAPFAKWFVGGKLNISENCLDRHVSPEGFRGNKAAIIWEGEPGDKRTLTYQQLHREVCRFANVLKRNNIKKGDRVIIYLPNIPETVVAMLACARIGVVHSVVFGGFSADSIRDRIADSGAIAVITADGSYRRGGIVPLKKNVDEALRDGTSVRRVIVFRRAGNEIHMEEGRDVWWHRGLEYVDANCPPVPLDSEHPLYLLYTSGSTGKPKAIRAFTRWGDQWVAKHDLSSLRLLGTVGEPINPEAWMWYYKNIGGGRCPVVDTWWQTETGSILITPLPGAIPTKPGSATLPFFGVDPAVVDERGHEVGPNIGGKLIIRRPWPAMLRTIYGDKTRYRKQYWSEFKGNYLTGDGARRDEDGYFWIVGRIDDVLNVAGHRLGTSEIESALVSHTRVAEAAVVGRPDELKGQGVVAFVTLKTGVDPTRGLKEELRDHVGAHIGAIAKPDEVRFAEALPKTRSGKIMRRLLKEIASGKAVTGDTTTLEDFSVLATLSDSEE